MTTLNDALIICGVILVIVVIPFNLLTISAGIQVFAGNWTAWNRVIDQGLHLIGLFSVLLCLLILILGAMFE